MSTLPTFSTVHKYASIKLGPTIMHMLQTTTFLNSAQHVQVTHPGCSDNPPLLGSWISTLIELPASLSHWILAVLPA